MLTQDYFYNITELLKKLKPSPKQSSHMFRLDFIQPPVNILAISEAMVIING